MCKLEPSVSKGRTIARSSRSVLKSTPYAGRNEEERMARRQRLDGRASFLPLPVVCRAHGMCACIHATNAGRRQYRQK